MSIHNNNNHRSIVKIICLFLMITMLILLIPDWCQSPKVKDIIYLEIFFGGLQEGLYLLKNYTKND